MLHAQNITKKWGQTKVLDDLSVSLAPGTITAIIGPNGCGKTTLFRLLAGIIAPTTGTVSRSERLKHCFFLQGHEMLYDHLQFVAAMYQSSQSLGALVKKLQLTAWIHRKVKHYSLGMKQQLLFAMALLSETSFYLLDEPFNGLDVIVAQRLKQQVMSLKKQGATIVFSSHQHSDSDQLADDCYFMKAGKLLEQTTIQPTTERYLLRLNRVPLATEIAYLTAEANVQQLVMNDENLTVTITPETIHAFIKSCEACQLTVKTVTSRLDETRRAYEALYGEEGKRDVAAVSL
ncbi:ABC transporter ATP-binding protein [Brochothrix campestris]|uniref:ABC transporter-like protein n=1 Tax=Brochothrix campestris FSL F6-1037 TaxID=1265861 RepID=W7D974_9LIST|nr:ABC transporter ATP-binding protein [Brochothrix campestris]EUJ41783.1 ABC transporter-like protein [Brochothrix campestris FSL F6-1037]